MPDKGSIRIVCGLGNPGEQYALTRHNAGFMAMSAVEEKLGVSVNNYKFKAKTAVASVGGKQCLLMKPETYAVKQLLPSRELHFRSGRE